jgi:hypothetical protein
LGRRRAARAAYYSSLEAVLAEDFPGDTVTWSVLDEMAANAAVPHPDAPVPNRPATYSDCSAFFEKLTSTGGLNVDAEIDALLAKLHLDFKTVSP